MARARNLKPSFFINEDLASCGMEARVLFAGLWCHADREGRLEDRPTRIKIQILPYDDVDVDCVLNRLAIKGFIQRYSVDGNKYIQIINFNKHQNPHVKEVASTIPAPDLSGAYPGITGTDPALTLNPLPLTLNPISMSGKGPTVREQAKIVLRELNRRTQRPRGFDEVDSNLSPITHRLKETDLQTVLDVTTRKILEWWNTDMDKYLRPATLYSAKNFSQYVGELGMPLKRSDKKMPKDVFTAEHLAIVTGPVQS